MSNIPGTAAGAKRLQEQLGEVLRSSKTNPLEDFAALTGMLAGVILAAYAECPAHVWPQVQASLKAQVGALWQIAASANPQVTVEALRDAGQASVRHVGADVVPEEHKP